MNINDLTIGQFKSLSKLFNPETNNQTLISMLNEKVIIRTYSAGVWFGELVEKNKNEVILINARRMSKWKCKQSISLSGSGDGSGYGEG